MWWPTNIDGEFVGGGVWCVGGPKYVDCIDDGDLWILLLLLLWLLWLCSNLTDDDDDGVNDNLCWWWGFSDRRLGGVCVPPVIFDEHDSSLSLS